MQAFRLLNAGVRDVVEPPLLDPPGPPPEHDLADDLLPGLLDLDHFLVGLVLAPVELVFVLLSFKLPFLLRVSGLLPFVVTQAVRRLPPEHLELIEELVDQVLNLGFPDVLLLGFYRLLLLGQASGVLHWGS